MELGMGIKLKPHIPQYEVNRQCLTLKGEEVAIHKCY